MGKYLPLIIGMTLVTYLPRLLPLLMLKDKEIHPKIKSFLTYIPFTSLSILITRGIMETGSEILMATLVGLGVAGLISWLKDNLILSVLAGILSSFIILNALG